MEKATLNAIEEDLEASTRQIANNLNISHYLPTVIYIHTLIYANGFDKN